MQDVIKRHWPAGADIKGANGVYDVALIGHPQGLRVGINADGRDPAPILDAWLSQHVQH